MRLCVLTAASHVHSCAPPLPPSPPTNHPHQATFEDCFAKQYSIIHRLETNKLRNVAKLFAHLLANDAISWGVLGCIRLTEEDTTSSSRIFIKYLFQVGLGFRGSGFGFCRSGGLRSGAVCRCVLSSGRRLGFQHTCQQVTGKPGGALLQHSWQNLMLPCLVPHPSICCPVLRCYARPRITTGVERVPWPCEAE